MTVAEKMSIAKRLASIPVLGRLAMLGYRSIIGITTLGSQTAAFARWWATSREFTNYTYELTPVNMAQLAAFCAQVAGISIERSQELIDELLSDRELVEHIRSATNQSAMRRFSDSEVRYGRRIGWYVLTRARRPRLVIETGIDKGLGACVLTAALLRNKEDGFPGRYVGTDIREEAGYLLSGKYATVGEILYGDSIASLQTLDESVGLFINDSDHSSDYERREYEVISPLLEADALVVGDNAHETNELFDFASATGRDFLFFREEPQRHWYTGAGIGVAWSAA